MRQRAGGHMLDLGFHADTGGNGYRVMPLLSEFVGQRLRCRGVARCQHLPGATAGRGPGGGQAEAAAAAAGAGNDRDLLRKGLQ
jgi:hypothetical protein